MVAGSLIFGVECYEKTMRTKKTSMKCYEKMMRILIFDVFLKPSEVAMRKFVYRNSKEQKPYSLESPKALLALFLYETTMIKS